MLLQSLLRPVLTPLMRGMFDAPIASSAAWSPLSLWPDGIATPGMWISPRDLTSQWADYTGTTSVVEPGTVADASNPVGLALDIRAGLVLGSELMVNSDFSSGKSGWSEVVGGTSTFTVADGKATITKAGGYAIAYQSVISERLHYQATVSIVSISGTGGFSNNAGTFYGTFTTAGLHTIEFTGQIGATSSLFFSMETEGGTVVVDNISVREVPGNHMLQSTSAARPLLSARVNLLTKTEDFADAVWFPSSTGTYTVEANTEIAPDGSMTASRYTAGPTGIPWMCQVYYVPLTGVFCVYARVISGNPSFGIRFNGGTGEEHVTLTDTWTRVEVNGISAGYCQYTMVVSPSSVLALWHPQLNLGPTALPYQRVTSASDYDSTGFPIAQLYDGTDDGMATAAFSAGTLTSAMDCMIAVRRDSAASCVAGLYNGVADATKFFGMAESASGSGCVGSGAGTPTVWVDNTQLTGGTAVTRGTLHTALTVGDWHILEFRNLDLSTWTAAGFGLYTSYVFPGPRGDIMFYPSTASTEDKDAARQWLADYYGVTLP